MYFSLPCSEFYFISASSCASENLSLQENVLRHCRNRERASQHLYYWQGGGINSAEAFRKKNRKEGLKFVGRLLENRKIKRIEDVTATESRDEFTYGSLCEDSLNAIRRKIRQEGKDSQFAGKYWLKTPCVSFGFVLQVKMRIFRRKWVISPNIVVRGNVTEQNRTITILASCGRLLCLILFR